jgi:hypothetical protein
MQSTTMHHGVAAKAREQGAAGADPHAPVEKGMLSLERAPVGGFDRLLPARPVPFVLAVLAIAGAFWAAGWALAADRARLLASREWLVQPLYLAVHLLLLRLFVNAYATNYELGCAALDVAPAETAKRMRAAVGLRSVLVACLVAVPFVWVDVAYLGEEEYLATEALGTAGALGAADWLLLALWALEWVVNAYVWVLILGFLVATVHVLRRHPFRDPVEQVLRERQYRPFLLMNAQGASLTLGFAMASAGYVWVARGAASDYVGLWVTGGLVFLAFVPPWMLLKSRVGAVVDADARRLGERVQRGAAALEEDGLRPATTLAEVAARVDLTLAIVRIEHLRRVHEELGKSEAQATVLRLLVPALTGAWKFFRPF